MSTLLDVEDLVVDYPVRGFHRNPVRALRGVSVDVRPGECLGIVGESGSGKTTLRRAVLGLAPVASGSIQLKGQNIVRLSRGGRRRLADKIQVVLRDSDRSLNPTLTVETALAEPLRAQRVPAAAAARRVRELLDQIGLPASAGRRLPREFTDGQRQRLAVARAMALSPELIICDEPVAALDPSSQATVLDLLVELQNTTGVAYVFISHDLALVRQASHRVAVMEHGEIVEQIEGDRVPGPRHGCPPRQFPTASVPEPTPRGCRSGPLGQDRCCARARGRGPDRPTTPRSGSRRGGRPARRPRWS
ncbi:ABC transporter ATP-binding protein [Parafrankia elaeagni]|uniref:ABC transporter ATP-binding protein n=1 Tax=Parafrankia elaeagni TaxID=222534 RepID=UPI00036C3262|nr:dipeptide/oligopeptide/nickel ABC transporter ATP-binding protein [Parafrankia elaeagni]